MYHGHMIGIPINIQEILIIAHSLEFTSIKVNLSSNNSVVGRYRPPSPSLTRSRNTLTKNSNTQVLILADVNLN